MGQSSSSPKTQLTEEYRQSLLSSVFMEGGEGKSRAIDMEKITMIIWCYRDSPEMVTFISNFLSKFSGEKLVFDGIEFYLPQLAHMIIHLEVDWPSTTLEQFALVISQHSLHFALQFNWILICALQDYQPETSSGEVNPTYNEVFFTRCIKLLQNMERCVVYGTPRASELRKLYDMGEISREEFEAMELADRRFNAFQIVDSPTQNLTERQLDLVDNVTAGSGSDIEFTQGNSGWLLYKRGKRRKYRRKPWKRRFFVVAERMLFCYDKPNGTLRRAMPLESAIVNRPKEWKYPFYFEVNNQNYQFLIRGSNEAEVAKWINLLEKNAKTAALFSMALSPKQSQSGQSQSLISHLSPEQRKRYQFFKGERDFVRSLCDIAEELRFEPREHRKALAPELIADTPIPPCAYVPMCKSTDRWLRVVRMLPNEARVFSTKERCPVLMCFDTEKEEEEVDVAEYLHDQFGDGPPTMHDNSDSFDQEAASSEASTPSKAQIDMSLGDAIKQSKTLTKFSTAAAKAKKKGIGTLMKEASKNVSKAFGNSPGRRFSKDRSYKTRNASPTPLSPSGRSKHQIWKETNSEPSSEASSDAQSSAASKNAKSPNKKRMNARLTKFMTDMPQVKMPKSLDSLKMPKPGKKKFNDPEYKRVKIYKSQSDAGIESQNVSDEALRRAEKYICGGESWDAKCARIRKDLIAEEGEEVNKNMITNAVIAKSNDDVRQEVFIMQMIHFYQSVFKEEGLPIFLKPYKILSTSKETGLIELLTNSTSIDGLKKSDGYPVEGGMRAYFELVYGPPSSADFVKAQNNFMHSLAGYSLVSYLLGLKDRHNGNIMINTKGQLIHIDFGFAFGMAPGHEFSMEKAPFKLTKEYVDILDGYGSPKFQEFSNLIVQGFMAARGSSQIALGLVEIMMHRSNYPCFSGMRYGGDVALTRFKSRLMLHITDERVLMSRARNLVKDSYVHWGTGLYDKFQKATNGLAV